MHYKGKHKKGKDMKKNKVFKSIICTLFVMCAMSMQVQAADNTFHTGVYIEAVDLSGMTEVEGEQALQEYVDTYSEEILTLIIGEDETQVALKDLGFTYANKEVLEEAMELGRTGNVLKRYMEVKDLEHKNKVYELEWEVDTTLVESFVNETCVSFDVDAVDGTLQREGDSFAIIAGVQGHKLDVTGAIDNIVSFVADEWSTGNVIVNLPVEIEEPKGSAEELSVIQDLLGSYSTSYTTSSTSRVANVSNGTSLINGTVLYPGEEFSTYEVVEPFTIENGYEMAGSYLNGKVVDSIGGGICQVSSTLYNAVLRAELEITERYGHSMTVSYVPVSADAAIAGTYKDFKFVNDSDYPIYIEGITTASKVVTFNIYGVETRASNRTITFESVTLSTTDAGQVIVADATQPLGYISIDSAYTGRVAELYKYVYIDGVEDSVTKVNKTTYSASPRTITVGVAGDEALSAAVQAAIATQDEATVYAALGY